MEKKLAKPNVSSGNPSSFKYNVSAEEHPADKMNLRRDLAKRNAMDKVRARSLAKPATTS